MVSPGLYNKHLATENVVFLSVNLLCCGWLHKTGSVEERLPWDSVGESVVSWAGHGSWADSHHRPLSDSILTLFGSFSVVASYGKLPHSHCKWVAGGSWWTKAGEVWAVRVVEAGGEATWCNDHSLCPRLLVLQQWAMGHHPVSHSD